jgi:hypothetical protein
MALARAEMWQDAQAAADRAVQESPGWAEAYRVRASIRKAMALTPEAQAALETPREGVDYGALRQQFETLAQDLETYVKLTPEEAPERERAEAELEAAQGLAEGCQKAEQTLLAEAERRRQEEAARQQAELERQQRLEQQRREEAARLAREAEEARLAEQRRQHEAVVAQARSKRSLGRGFLITGGALALGAGTFMYLGANQNERIRSGGFATAAEIGDAASTGRTYNTLATAGVIGAGVMTLIGLPLILFNGDPPPVSVSVTAGGDGVGAVFVGAWP